MPINWQRFLSWNSADYFMQYFPQVVSLFHFLKIRNILFDGCLYFFNKNR